MNETQGDSGPEELNLDEGFPDKKSVESFLENLGISSEDLEWRVEGFDKKGYLYLTGDRYIFGEYRFILSENRNGEFVFSNMGKDYVKNLISSSLRTRLSCVVEQNAAAELIEVDQENGEFRGRLMRDGDGFLLNIQPGDKDGELDKMSENGKVIVDFKDGLPLFESLEHFADQTLYAEGEQVSDDPDTVQVEALFTAEAWQKRSFS